MKYNEYPSQEFAKELNEIGILDALLNQLEETDQKVSNLVDATKDLENNFFPDRKVKTDSPQVKEKLEEYGLNRFAAHMDADRTFFEVQLATMNTSMDLVSLSSTLKDLKTYAEEGLYQEENGEFVPVKGEKREYNTGKSGIDMDYNATLYTPYEIEHGYAKTKAEKAEEDKDKPAIVIHTPDTPKDEKPYEMPQRLKYSIETGNIVNNLRSLVEAQEKLGGVDPELEAIYSFVSSRLGVDIKEIKPSYEELTQKERGKYQSKKNHNQEKRDKASALGLKPTVEMDVYINIHHGAGIKVDIKGLFPEQADQIRESFSKNFESKYGNRFVSSGVDFGAGGGEDNLGNDHQFGTVLNTPDEVREFLDIVEAAGVEIDQEKSHNIEDISKTFFQYKQQEEEAIAEFKQHSANVTFNAVSTEKGPAIDFTFEGQHEQNAIVNQSVLRRILPNPNKASLEILSSDTEYKGLNFADVPFDKGVYQLRFYSSDELTGFMQEIQREGVQVGMQQQTSLAMRSEIQKFNALKGGVDGP